jgi:UDP-N-acetylmuramoylalanine--D-glutamate ligase
MYQAHLDYHGSLKNYYQAKMNIFKYQKEGDIGFTYPFKKNINIPKKDIPLIGKHNLLNIYAAVSVAKLFKISDTNIKKAIKNFKPLPYRLENVGMHKGIIFYDDSISTTPESTIEALHALKKVDTIFLGGSDEGFNYKELEKTLRAKKVRNIVLFPDTGKRILRSERGFNALHTKSMKAAVSFAYKNTKPGSICLLSTASPSTSIWKNYIEKGSEFQKYIKSI